MMPAMTSLSWFPAVMTCLSPPCDFLTRSERFRRGEFPDTRNNSTHPCPRRAVWQQNVLAIRAKITGLGASNLSHGWARPVIVMTET